jgi:phage/plasmid-associated DNA primase
MSEPDKSNESSAPDKLSKLPPGITEEIIEVNHETGESRKVFCGFNKTDMGNAERLIALHGHNIRYCAELKEWLLWDGVRWITDITNVIQELAKDTVLLIHAEIPFQKDKEARKALSAWAFASEAHVRINAMIKSAESDPRITQKVSDFDSNLYLINCPNGTLDLKNKEFREHRREDLLTKLTGAPYNPWAPSELFFPTLIKALPPQEIIYGQRMLGSFLEPTTKNKEWLFIYGMPFALKSSVTQSVYAALGDYAGAFDVNLLTKSRHGVAANAARPELIALEGLRIAWSEEAPPNFIIDDAMLKSLTSSGTKSTRQIFQKQRELKLICSFVLESNGAFNFDMDDEWSRDAAMQRTKVMKFVNQIPESERDQTKFIKLTSDEAELTAALTWVIQGYFDRKECGIDEPESIKETSEEFQTVVNPLNEFVKQEVIFDDGTDDEGAIKFEVRSYVSDLYQRFQETADQDLVKRFKNQRSFNTHFSKIAPYYAKKAGVDIESHKFNTGVAWLNVRLAELSDDPDIVLTNTSSMSPINTGDAKGDEVTQNSGLVNLILYYTDFLRDFNQKGFLRHHATFPSILVEGLKPKEAIKSTIEAQYKEILEGDAKFEENSEHGEDQQDLENEVNVEPLSHNPGHVKEQAETVREQAKTVSETTEVKQAEFNLFILKTLGALRSSQTAFEPEVLCGETVQQYCTDHNINGDRKTRLVLGKRFAEFVNNGEAAHLFLKLTGGKPLILGGM